MLRFLSFFLLLGIVSSGLVKYDQSQNGDYNVHLDLKNIEVLAFFDDSSVNLDGEYEYDYGELTLKPPALPSNATNPTENPILSSTPTISADQNGPASNETSAATENNSTTTTTNKPHRRCGAGFYRDTTGRCRRLRRPIKLGGIIQNAKNKLTG